MNRYARIEKKNKREIVLLQGRGCRYKRCRFCDYYLDVSSQMEQVNTNVLSEVSGVYGILEVINSGSFGELTMKTWEEIRNVAVKTKLHTLIFECHYLYRDEIPRLRAFFEDFKVRIKLGLETFDYDLREKVLKKGIKERDIAKIAQSFDEANFLVGLEGQSLAMIERDLKKGLEFFDRICVNIVCKNSKIKPQTSVITDFMQDLYPLYCDDERIDFLIENTDFGVG